MSQEKIYATLNTLLDCFGKLRENCGEGSELAKIVGENSQLLFVRAEQMRFLLEKIDELLETEPPKYELENRELLWKLARQLSQAPKLEPATASIYSKPPANTTLILGEWVPNSLLNVREGRIKREIPGLYRVETHQGRVIARFGSLEEAEDWWKQFRQIPMGDSVAEELDDAYSRQDSNQCTKLSSCSDSRIVVPAGLDKVRNAWLKQESAEWIIVTKRNIVVARFKSEADARTWWKEFKRDDPVELKNDDQLLREAGRSTKAKKTAKAAKRNVGGRNVPAPSAYNDPLMPWSEEYDMAEWDYS